MKRLDDHGIFDIKVVHRDILPGSILVAEPFLREGYFNHAVISLVDYSREEGAMGVVMNNPLSGTSLQDVMSSVKRNDPIPVYCGGPVASDRIYFLHALSHLFPDDIEISEGLYVGRDFATIIDYVNSGYPLDGRLRFFIGYSGWEPKQLEKECMENVWAVNQPVLSAEEALTGDEDAYWHKTVRRLGEEYRQWLLHPKNPSLN